MCHMPHHPLVESRILGHFVFEVPFGIYLHKTIVGYFEKKRCDIGHDMFEKIRGRKKEEPNTPL